MPNSLFTKWNRLPHQSSLLPYKRFCLGEELSRSGFWKFFLIHLLFFFSSTQDQFWYVVNMKFKISHTDSNFLLIVKIQNLNVGELYMFSLSDKIKMSYILKFRLLRFLAWSANPSHNQEAIKESRTVWFNFITISIYLSATLSILVSLLLFSSLRVSGRAGPGPQSGWWCQWPSGLASQASNKNKK